MAEQTSATLSWNSGLQFTARTASGHGVILDSPVNPNRAGGGPMELMLVAIAGCTAMDIVSILARMRQPLTALSVEITGDRAEKHPKYCTAISIVYHVRGKGLTREKVEHAVELSHSTYCSASASLRPDCPITTTIDISED
jgi:putative redox protein